MKSPPYNEGNESEGNQEPIEETTSALDVASEKRESSSSTTSSPSHQLSPSSRFSAAATAAASSSPHSPHNIAMQSPQYSSGHDGLPSPQESRCLLPPISLVSTCEEMNPSKRSSFEDCSIYAPSGTWDVPDENMAFLAVADGHGGRDIVEFLEDGLLYHVSQELQIEQDDSDIRDDGNTGSGGNDRDANHNPTISSDDSIPKRLERAFLMVDIHSKAMGLTNSGATVAMCLVTRGNSIYDDTSTIHPKDDNDDNNDNVWKIYAANAGDARIVLGHGGKAHRMTRDHRTDDPEEVRRIEDSGGFIFKGRVLGILAVTRSLGDHCMKEYVIAKPYTSERTIVVTSEEEDTSFIIIACDGLWDVFQDQEAVDFVLERIEEKEFVAKYLVEEALKRGSTDNITVSVAFLA